MTQKPRTLNPRIIVAILVVGSVSTAAGLAWQRGLLVPAAWPWNQSRDLAAEPGSGDADEVPEIEPELPPEIAEAQYEPGFNEERALDEEEPDTAPDVRLIPTEPEEAIGDRISAETDVVSYDLRDISPVDFQQRAAAAREGAEDTTPRAARATVDREATKRDAAAGIPEPVAEDSWPADARDLLDSKEIEALVSAGDLVTAQHELSRWYWRKPELRERLLPRLNEFAEKLYFAPQPHFYEPYEIQPSDQLRVVAQRYKLSWEYLARLNRVDARKIRMGQKLKVMPGPFGVIISLSRYELVVHQEGSFVKSYRVGIGKDGSTPVGVFAVKNKMVDPTYYGPEGVIAHDDPQNPLGERWIDIGDSYGLHGTIEPDSIGKSESRGCIRLLNDDVAEVYDLLVVGSEVRIRR